MMAAAGRKLDWDEKVHGPKDPVAYQKWVRARIHSLPADEYEKLVQAAERDARRVLIRRKKAQAATKTARKRKTAV